MTTGASDWAEFYDEIASDYDAITGSSGRGHRAEEFLKALRARFEIKSALDVACGTGLYAILLAKMGVQSAGTDMSAKMLDLAGKRAQEANVHVDWVCAPMQELAGRFPRRFDAVLCMGNSIPHLLTDADLDATIGGFAKMLNEGGIVVLQLLNYTRIMARQERIVGINRLGDKEYVRFYDFLGEQVRFNILEIAWASGAPEHRLLTTTLRPYTADTLRRALIEHGCGSVEAFGGLGLTPFDENSDETVMLIGCRL
jgi:SAM-dependent methyltransferase